MSKPSRLQQELADRIALIIGEDGLEIGSLLNENGLARRLEVSRTPIRGALRYLEDQGVVVRRADRGGVELIKQPPKISASTTEASLSSNDDDEWLVHIARDRKNGDLADDVSEVEIMRLYDLGRPRVRQILTRLSELGMVERKPGYGWRFLTERRDVAGHDESYDFRMMIEPMGILLPTFHLDSAWIEAMRRRHLETLEQPWQETSAIAFFEMNAAFHEGLAAASGNRFVQSSMVRQNQLRRFSQYDWKFGFDRVVVNSREHLEMLDYLARGEREIASLLMRRHLERARDVRSTDSSDPG